MAGGGGGSRYRSGTPSLLEWDGLWKASPRDADVTADESARVDEHLHRRLQTLGPVGFGEGDAFHFRGDNYGDRTAYLEIVQPDALTADLLRTLQSWLQDDPRLQGWRMFVVTYLDIEDAIMIYPSAIRHGRDPALMLEELTVDLVARMKARDADEVTADELSEFEGGSEAMDDIADDSDDGDGSAPSRRPREDVEHE